MFDKLRKANIKRSVDWCGHEPRPADMEFKAIEFAGEAGEVMDAVKKLIRHRDGLVGGVGGEDAVAAIADELADTIISADRLAAGLGIDLARAVEDKFNKTSEKHGFKTMAEYLR